MRLLRQRLHAVAVPHDRRLTLSRRHRPGAHHRHAERAPRLSSTCSVLGDPAASLLEKQDRQGLHVPLPKTFGMPHLDRRTDVTQVGATALALILGRPLADEEYPLQISDMTANALALSPDGGSAALTVRGWLQRALQIDLKTPFSSAPEAWAELDRVLHYSDPIAEIEALKVFLSRYHAVVGTADPLQAPTRQAPPAAVMSSPVSPKPSPVTAAAVPATLTQAAPAHTPMPTSNHASPSSSSPASTPQALRLHRSLLRSPLRHQRRRSQQSRP